MNDENTATEAVNETDAPEAQEAVETPPEAPAEAPEADIEAELSAAWDKATTEGPLRDENGRFMSDAPEQEQPAEESIEQEGQAPEQEQEETLTEAIPVPVSWSAEAKAAWDSVPPEAQAIIAQRDTEAQQQISRQGNEIKQLEPVKNVLEQYSGDFERYGIEPTEGIARLFEAQRMLERNPVPAIQQLAASYGVDLTQFGQPQGEPGETPDPRILQELNQLRGELSQTQQQLTARERAEQAARTDAVQNQIDAFKQSHEHFETIEREIEAQVRIINETEPGLTVVEKLERAYETALWTNPTTRADMLKKQELAKEAEKLEEAKKRAETAKKAKPLNVKSSNAKSATPKSSDEILEEVASRIYG